MSVKTPYPPALTKVKWSAEVLKIANEKNESSVQMDGDLRKLVCLSTVLYYSLLC
jgi:hypothetical protein